MLGLLCLIAGCLFFIPIRSNNALQVSFLAYTNDATADKLAIFAVTNSGEKEIVFCPLRPLIKIKNQWSTLNYFPYGTSFYPVMKNVPPHASVTFAIAAITNSESWQTPLWWHYEKQSLIELIRIKVENNLYYNWQNMQKGAWPKFYNTSGIQTYRAHSPEITNN